MSVNVNSGLLLYGSGSLMGATSYLLIVLIQQLMGPSLSRLFFTIDYNELILVSCYSGLWALVLMFINYDKYRNLLISLLPGLTYLAVKNGGLGSVLNSLNLNMFTNYQTIISIVVFCILWGFGIPKLLKQS